MEKEIDVDTATLQLPAVDIDIGIPAAPAANLFVPPLPISKNCVWKTVKAESGVDVEIAVDVYLPAPALTPGPTLSAISSSSSKCKPGNGDGKLQGKCKGSDSAKGDHQLLPIMLFIHGGAWLGSNRSDYCRPLFHQFLELGFVVASMDYRLRPETNLEGQLEDVRDVEGWLRGSGGGLGEVLKGMRMEIGGRGSGIRVDVERVVVVGASAGAHLALLTPKLWTKPPSAILSMYGPTTIHSLQYQQKGRFSKRCSLPCTAETLAAATNYALPPTEKKISQTGQDNYRPRNIMARHLFESGMMAEFLIKGLVRGKEGELCFPERGSATKEEIDSISPIHLLTTRQHPYPPVYQVMGTSDDVFDPLHVHDFHDELNKQGIPAHKVLVPNVLHAFDILAEIGGEVDREIVGPAVRWVARWVGVEEEM
ncbi:hypothetical protein ONS95_012914 [Cadophora gregata]|uniref:uncharacterized protein n=1 Tax=Cadophora gregata TaxID=51156 RepID=UPI0026DDB5FD|nr:uncharacterized protein ONS95_012914 [Cadophora gregata]KAK0115866.1 hypothetical protein ONS95_012914 [Cadophora gregata]